MNQTPPFPSKPLSETLAELRASLAAEDRWLAEKLRQLMLRVLAMLAAMLAAWKDGTLATAFPGLVRRDAQPAPGAATDAPHARKPQAPPRPRYAGELRPASAPVIVSRPAPQPRCAPPAVIHTDRDERRVWLIPLIHAAQVVRSDPVSKTGVWRPALPCVHFVTISK